MIFSYKEVSFGIEIFGKEDPCKDILVIPDTIDGKDVVSIGKNAFSNYTFSEIILPSSLYNIGEDAFSNCKKLKSIQIPENVKILKENTFYSSGICEINTNKVEIIEERAFCDCNQLLKVRLPFVKEIKPTAFYFCQNLSDVIFSNNLIYIGRQAFMFCNLSFLEIPLSVSCIEEGAFDSNKELAHILLPESVDTIEDGVFNNCNAFLTIHTEKKVKPDSWCKWEYETVWGDKLLSIYQEESILEWMDRL